MKSTRIFILFLAMFGIFAVGPALGQGTLFSDPSVDYSFDVPDGRWKMTVKPSAARPNVEYVFIDRNDGHLEVRRMTVAKNAILADIVRDEEQKLQFLPGYVAGPDENFSGRIRGSIFNFEFVPDVRWPVGSISFVPTKRLSMCSVSPAIETSFARSEIRLTRWDVRLT
jgi:hypothetical protein